MSDFMSVDEVQKQIKPGDLIVFDRGQYKHWGICISDEEIVHITGSINAIFGSLSASSSSSIDSLCDPNTERAVVKCERLKSVAEGHKVRIDNKTGIAKSKGLTARDTEEIVQECLKIVGHVITYSLVTYNCEHFVTKLRYGVPWSDQVKNTVAGAAVGIGVLSGLATVVAGVLAVISIFVRR